MFKHLLALTAAAALTATASALDLGTPNGGWGYSFDTTTNTITYEGAWNGCGWGWWDGLADFSDYTHVVIETEPVAISAQLVVQYNDGINTEINQTSGFCETGNNEFKMKLDDAIKGGVQQIYLQCGATPGSITLVSAKVIDASGEGPDLVLWKGNYTASGWNSGTKVSRSQVKVGDILHYHMTPGNKDAQVLLKGDNWANLLGSAKIENSSIIDGIAEVVVTQEMLDNCGDGFFLQGDGGITCTLIELGGEMEVDEGNDIICFGTRQLPMVVFATIPDDYTTITVVLDSMPQWVMLCDADWHSLAEGDAVEYYEDEAGVLVTFHLTADAIAQINAKKQFVINGDTSVQALGVAHTTSLPGGIADSVADTDTTPRYYHLNGIEVSGANLAPGLYIKKAGDKTTKVYVR